jgi:hypothetical protein
MGKSIVVLRTMKALVMTALVAGVAGCGLVSELQSNQMAVALLLQSPSVPNPSNPTTTIPGITTFSVEFASVSLSAVNGNAANAATPTDGAMVVLKFHDVGMNVDRAITVPGKGNGTYFLDSTNSNLVYQSGQPYTVVITYAGSTYEMTTTPGAAVKINEFEPGHAPAPAVDGPVADTLINWPPNTAFTITRDPPTDANVAFWDLATYSGNTPTDVATNRPATASDFLNLILNESTFELPSFTIPGSNFKANQTYVVSLVSVAQGSQVTSDASVSPLFPGSNFYGGAASSGVLTTN